MANLSNINGKFVVEQTTGYVGVGTTDPSYPIEVLNASAEIALNASGASIYRLRSDNTDSFRINKNGVGDRLVIAGNGNATFAGDVHAGGRLRSDVGSDSGTQLNLWADSNGSTFLAGYDFAIYTGNNNARTQSFVIDHLKAATFAGTVTAASNSFKCELDGSANALIDISSTGSQQIRFFDTNSSYTEAMRLLRFDDKLSITYGDNANEEALTVVGTGSSAGNVGIGTTLPGEKLEVDGNAELKGNLIINKFSTTSPYADGEIRFTGQYDRYVGGIKTYSDNASYPDYANGLDFFVQRHVYALPNGHLAMRIDSEGNVGIGTDSPVTKLHVSNTTVINDAYGLALVENTSTGSGGVVNSAVNVKNYYGTSQFMQWEGNGLRIGSRILTNSGVGDVYFTAGADSVKMVVKAGGNVGIGVTSPNTKLDVSGPTGTRNRSTTGNSSVYETSLYFGVSGNSTANVSIDTSTVFPPMVSGGFILVEVSASGYGNSGSNGLIFSYITGGYGGHYAALNQPYHPVAIIVNSMQAGTCTWYNPNPTTIGITVTTTNSQGLTGLMRVKVTTTY